MQLCASAANCGVSFETSVLASFEAKVWASSKQLFGGTKRILMTVKSDNLRLYYVARPKMLSVNSKLSDHSKT